MFDYDWFHGHHFQDLEAEARSRCAFTRFPNLDPATADDDPEYAAFRDALEVRRLVYLRDGFSYELKSLVDVEAKSRLTFECEPVDDQYKVGVFLVTVPFEDVVRVEVFAVHPTEKPDDMPVITGFRSRPETPPSRDG